VVVKHLTSLLLSSVRTKVTFVLDEEFRRPKLLVSTFSSSNIFLLLQGGW
jgi:hypothetical protein